MDREQEIQKLKARNTDIAKWLNTAQQQTQAANIEVVKNDAKIELLEQQLKEEKPKEVKK